ncbi:hypothetical protein GF312_20390 [Candidatus Poribacteria bacterium]|nr:hypothetical protein [Candidatus Poribacteria bacterium]
MTKRILFSLFIMTALVFSHAVAKDIDGLVMYFSFDAGNGDEVIDESGNGNNGEITGAEWDNGIYGGALSFDGASFVEVPSSDSLEGLLEEMTVMCWINPTLTGSGWQGVVTKGADGAEHFELLINTDAHIHTAQMFAGGRAVADRGNVLVTADEWNHVAVTYKEGEWIVYLNGEEGDNSVAASGELVPDGQPLVIGDERPMNRLYEGLIDEVAVFNRVLPQDEINDLMNNSIADVLPVEPAGKLTTTWAETKK